mmetsp:Transcript_35939/g.101115  ORF Transcript_35939/g.101115 Transcript_35939/m.101115 type:complete len:229 (+) Transcript_35939:84-770(+)
MIFHPRFPNPRCPSLAWLYFFFASYLAFFFFFPSDLVFFVLLCIVFMPPNLNDPLADHRCSGSGVGETVVIMHGRNLYPADIEPVLEEAHPMIRRGCLVITGLTEIDLGIMQNAKKRKAKHGDSVTERISKCKVKDGLLVAAIAELRTKEDYAKYAKDNYDGNDRREAMMKDTVVAIKKSMITSERIALQLVVLVEARSLPKTSSGKKRRAHVRQLLVDGKLNVLYVG